MRRLYLTIGFLALCLPAPAQQTPAAPPPMPKPLLRVFTGPPTWTTVPVDVTDADVSADLVPAVTRAMSAGVDRQRLLFVLSKEASESGRVCVITRGVHGGDFFPDWKGERQGGTTTQTFRVPVHNSLPPPFGVPDTRRFYSLRQTLLASAHLTNKDTAAVSLHIAETAIPAAARWGGVSTAATLIFHSGETQLLTTTTRADGARHLVFVTVHIVPPNTACHPGP